MTDQDPLGIAGELIAEKYRIESMVGEGGFAVVYRAQHTVWEKPVAVKFFNGLSQAPVEHREALQRAFIQEGALLTELSSQTAGIVQARDVGTYATPSGQWMPYMVLEWLEGFPLDAVLDQDQAQGIAWTEIQVLGFLERILKILAVAHQHGVVHRDIKPANVFVMGSAARSFQTPIKLLDFGVAKMLSEHTKTSAALAKTGLAITSFTPQYAAPEQFTRSYGATGPWTDVYAVALVASEMMVGKPVLEGEDVVQLGFATANPARRPTPAALGVPISDEFEAALQVALQVDPQDRFADASAFLEACLALLETRRSSSRPAPAPNLGAPSRPPPLASAAQRVSPVPAAVAASLSVPNGASEARARTQHASASTVDPPQASKESAFGVLLVILIVLAGGTVVYSATDLRGAEQTRTVIVALAGSSKAKLLGWIGASGLSPSDATSSSSPSSAGPAEASAAPAQACPPGTRRILAESDAGSAASACIDEQPVGEVEYAACDACDKPRLAPKVWKRQRTQGGAPLSKYCVGRAPPTSRVFECATADQAAGYCSERGARLPTLDELRLAAQPGERGARMPTSDELQLAAQPGERGARMPTLDELRRTPQPVESASPAKQEEWTAPITKKTGAAYRPFRCVVTSVQEPAKG